MIWKDMFPKENRYFETENGILYCGDCLEIMKELPKESVDLVLTDIPYGEVNRKSNGLRNLDKKDADKLSFAVRDFLDILIRKVTGSVYIWCGTLQAGIIRKYLIDKGFSTRIGVWEKTNPSPMNGQYIWLSGIEWCVYGKLPKATFNEFCKNTVWRFPSGRSKIHPTQKPITLFSYLITVSSNENDLILDPFIGSGTTAVACEQLNRRWIGIEINPEYCEITKQRILKEINQTKLNMGEILNA